MTSRTDRPARPNDRATMDNFAAALGPMLNMALRPFQQDHPAEYLHFMAALAEGTVPLHLTASMSNNGRYQIQASTVDAEGKPFVISTLLLNGPGLN
jgi:hypothetical protein